MVSHGEREVFFRMILSHCRKGAGFCEDLIICQSSRPVNEEHDSILSAGDKRCVASRCLRLLISLMLISLYELRSHLIFKVLQIMSSFEVADKT